MTGPESIRGRVEAGLLRNTAVKQETKRPDLHEIKDLLIFGAWQVFPGTVLVLAAL